jgi:catechol 2,3-dioxygenase-like lactoylglutathione lyase family enzyme
MAFHHLALATNDMDATHRFYTEAMGFELVKAVVAPTPSGEGWAKHVFYDTGGGGMIAFWDLHDDRVGTDDCSISSGMGLPGWVNHLAFDASLDQLEAFTERWLRTGRDVVEVDHGFCRSIYTEDPNGNTVEWCADVRALTDQDRAEAAAALADPNPPLEVPPMPTFHLAADFAAADGLPVGS